MMVFLALALAMILDPIALAIYITVGIACRRFWIAAAGAVAGAAFMELFFWMLRVGSPARGYSTFEPRLLGAIVVVSLAYFIASAIRKRRGRA